jgi:hypothetical protein
MQHHRKADVADLRGHVASDALPRVARPIDAVDAAVILLIQPVGLEGMQGDAMGVLPVLGIRVG